ncbi:MAG TPA: hypothetical protein VJI70_03560 [Candidatus Paceibacterota bacterium]
MKSRPLTTTLAILLTIVLAAPSAFLMAPQNVYAQWTTFEVNPALVATTPVIAAKTTFSAIKDTLNLISTYTNTAANVAMQINAYVLQPLAFVMSGNLLKLITASVLDFVIGKTNGTGAPQFVQDLNGNLQRVGDIQANAFFVQFGRNSNSPFASAIVSSLRTNYLWNTSSAGFFAANRNTMAMYSLNPNAFLNGNWSQGGVGAWFALTTQTQNNPYTFYQASQSQLASVVSSAISARLAELNWSQGFLSWCGANDASEPVSEEEFPVSGGVNPGDSCFDKDGNIGTIKTPGSTIKATLDKVLGSTQDKLVQMGSLAKEINGILGNIGTVLGTVQFASEILGGPGSGGLFGVGQTSATNPTSRLLQYQSPGYLGVTPSTVYQNAATLPASGQDMSSRVAQYESSWNTIRSAANSASTTVASLASFCDTAANSQTDNTVFLSAATAQADAARSAITTQIAPVLVQANSASVVIAVARAMVQKIQAELNSGVDTTSSEYLADLQTLQTMRPSDSDIGDALIEIESFHTAAAIPSGSLIVSGGSIIDRMSLISTNAEALKTSVCTESARTDSGDSTGGD